ncbi:chromosome segregation protein SMC [Clostridium butyricum]|uniref:chromosome segregation protein SMC n=1 Tax=Clostridium butyricum TaxID=1492 RepID=UPI002AB1E659|nr:chromosome segregation protein SMC [Clostridium butyricum]
MGNLYNQMDKHLEELPLNIYSPVFTEMMECLDKELQNVLKNVYEGKFESGDVKLSLNVEIINAITDVPTTDKETGEIITKEVAYKKPKFEYKVNSTLKKKHETKGEYEEKREIVLEDDGFIARTLIDPQVRFEIENK